ncbi:MAG TPA: aspartate/glutamate racemase family protein [Anaerolineales bacterium]|nr:aspartate/glutamate racemase family protein [Anaerolineales bacterium]HRK89660.1 aspartate/glutamate racemase family protein [Anaerolineales bacterium]
MTLPSDPMRWFSETLRLTGVAHTAPEKQGVPEFVGKRLGLLNGSAWVVPWANYFGRLFIPGAHLINVGNEAVQINFMEAHERGLPTPPQSNIDAFVRYARDLAELGHVDAILITCSTMNRSYPAVMDAMKPYNIPVIQIDRPIMERAVQQGGKTLVIATHGPTVSSTQALLSETATELNSSIEFAGETVEVAWHRLADGDVQGHNELLARAIRAHQKIEKIDSVVLAQLSMTVFLLSYPDPSAEFGIPVFTSGQCGFEEVAEVLKRA